jgi:hypothetical protein
LNNRLFGQISDGIGAVVVLHAELCQQLRFTIDTGLDCSLPIDQLHVTVDVTQGKWEGNVIFPTHDSVAYPIIVIVWSELPHDLANSIPLDWDVNRAKICAASRCL